MDPNFYSDQPDEAGDTFQNLCNSDYSKVIFCDLYYNNDSTVGCRFQITDHVHEDPCDYIGLFRVGFVNLSQCLATKMLSNCDCEEDGKLLRCTFKRKLLFLLCNISHICQNVSDVILFYLFFCLVKIDCPF